MVVPTKKSLSIAADTPSQSQFQTLKLSFSEELSYMKTLFVIELNDFKKELFETHKSQTKKLFRSDTLTRIF